MSQTATMFVITNPRTKRDGNGAKAGQMEGDICRRPTRTLPGRQQIDQTLPKAKNRLARTPQGARTYGLTGVGRGVAVGLGVGVGRGVAVGLGVGRGVAVGLGVGVGRGVAVGPGVGRGVAVGKGVGRGVAVGAGVGRGVVAGATVARGVAAGVGVATEVEVAVILGARAGIGVGRGVGAGGAIDVAASPTGDTTRPAMRAAEDCPLSVIWLAWGEPEMVVAPVGAVLPSTTIMPSPRVNWLPSVVVMIPVPVTAATVTLPSSDEVGDAALTNVAPTEAGLKLPFGVTTSTEVASKLSPVACTNSPPDIRLTEMRGMGAPFESIPASVSIAPMVSCASGCNSSRMPGATSMTMRPSWPVVITAPSGRVSPTFDSASLETPSTTMSELPSACRTVPARATPIVEISAKRTRIWCNRRMGIVG